MGAHDNPGPEMVRELMGQVGLPCVEDFEGPGGMIRGGGPVEYFPACGLKGKGLHCGERCDPLESMPKGVRARRSRARRSFAKSGHATMRRRIQVAARSLFVWGEPWDAMAQCHSSAAPAARH